MTESTNLEAIKTVVIEKLTEFKGTMDELGDRVLGLEQSGVSAAGILTDASKHPRYNLGKVFAHLADPRNNNLDGYELEQHEELKAKGIQVPLADSVMVPLDKKSIDYSALSPTAAGSSVVEVQTRSLVELLRERSIVLGLNPTLILASGDVDIPRLTTGHSAYWISGDDLTATTESNPVFERVQMRPKFVASYVRATLRMMTQAVGSNDISRIIANDMTGLLAEEIDNKIIQGSGSSNQPTGITNTSNVNTDTWTGSPSHPVWDDILEMEKQLADDKALFGNLHAITDPATMKSLKGQVKYGTDAGAGFITEGKMMNGYPIQTTSNCPADTIIFGNWNELIVTEFMNGIALAADPYTNFSSGAVGFRAVMALDVNVRHPVSFCISTIS